MKTALEIITGRAQRHTMAAVFPYNPGVFATDGRSVLFCDIGETTSTAEHKRPPIEKTEKNWDTADASSAMLSNLVEFLRCEPVKAVICPNCGHIDPFEDCEGCDGSGWCHCCGDNCRRCNGTGKQSNSCEKHEPAEAVLNFNNNALKARIGDRLFDAHAAFSVLEQVLVESGDELVAVSSSSDPLFLLQVIGSGWRYAQMGLNEHGELNELHCGKSFMAWLAERSK